MKHLFKNHSLRHIPISRRIFLLILIISILPITLVGNFSFFQAKNTISSLSKSYNTNLINTLRYNIELTFQDYFNVADELMLDPTVRNALLTFDTLAPHEKYDVTLNITSEIRSKFSRIANIFNIRIVTPDNIPIHNSGYLFLSDTDNQQNFNRIRTSSGSSIWYITEHSGKPYFVLSRKIRQLSDGKDIGYIIIHIQPGALKKTFSGFDKNTTFTLVDSFQNTFSSSKEECVLSEENLNYVTNQPNTTQILSYDNSKKYSITYTYLDTLDWKLIECVPHALTLQPINTVRTGIFLMIAGCLIFSIIISRYIWKSISIPLNEMIHSIENVSNVSFKTHATQNKDDELEFLSDAYNKILKKMEDMATQIETEQEEKRIAEIKMLQAQINPHFLFNTLDSLRFTAMMSNATTVSEGLSSLSHILRNSIANGESYITISEEVKNIENYLTIQKIRYGETIQFDADISDDTKNCMIMKFLLQPIVENSVIHGLSDDTFIHIHMTSHQKDGIVTIFLIDNGIGFDVDSQYDSEHDRYKSSKLSGIGLENVRQRLKLEYGSQQSFIIESEKGIGTTVMVSFPANRKGVTE